MMPSPNQAAKDLHPGDPIKSTWTSIFSHITESGLIAAKDAGGVLWYIPPDAVTTPMPKPIERDQELNSARDIDRLPRGSVIESASGKIGKRLSDGLWWVGGEQNPRNSVYFTLPVTVLKLGG